MSLLFQQPQVPSHVGSIERRVQIREEKSKVGVGWFEPGTILRRHLSSRPREHFGDCAHKILEAPVTA